MLHRLFMASGPGGAADGAEAPARQGMPAGFAATSVAALIECPLKVRVKLNSPSLCPTIFSVTYTGMNFFPILYRDRVPHLFRNHGRTPRPGAQHFLLIARIHAFYPRQKVSVHKCTFFR